MGNKAAFEQDYKVQQLQILLDNERKMNAVLQQQKRELQDEIAESVAPLREANQLFTE